MVGIDFLRKKRFIMILWKFYFQPLLHKPERYFTEYIIKGCFPILIGIILAGGNTLQR